MIELDSVLFPHFGEQSMPYYEEPEFGPEAVSPEQRAEYPLVYTTGARNITMFNSEHRQIPSLRAINHDPMVTIHLATAEACGIHAADWVRVEGIFGLCVLKAKVSKQVGEKLIHLEHAWWFPEEEGEAPNLFGVWKANASNLMPLESVGVTGYGVPYKNGICKISRVSIARKVRWPMPDVMLINYGFCTGRHSCEVSCRKEKNLPIDEWGIKVQQIGSERLGGQW